MVFQLIEHIEAGLQEDMVELYPLILFFDKPVNGPLIQLVFDEHQILGLNQAVCLVGAAHHLLDQGINDQVRTSVFHLNPQNLVLSQTFEVEQSSDGEELLGILVNVPTHSEKVVGGNGLGWKEPAGTGFQALNGNDVVVEDGEKEALIFLDLKGAGVFEGGVGEPLLRDEIQVGVGDGTESQRLNVKLEKGLVILEEVDHDQLLPSDLNDCDLVEEVVEDELLQEEHFPEGVDQKEAQLSMVVFH